MDRKKYLTYGLNAVSRAHTMNYFVDGHRGGAIISGVYLCQENEGEAGLPNQIASIIDKRWSTTALCAPFPSEPADPTLLNKILTRMQAYASDLREAGHNIILPTLALKAFRDVPEAVTPTRVNGICQMIDSFTKTEIKSTDPINMPDLQNRSAFADFILTEFVQCTQRFNGRGQGWSGHLLTYSRALLDLIDLDYVDTARQAAAGFQLYLQRIRSGPQEIDKPRPEHIPIDAFPLQTAYWNQREGDLNLGHQIKYPYGFYGLLGWAGDKTIQQKALAAAYRVF